MYTSKNQRQNQNQRQLSTGFYTISTDTLNTFTVEQLKQRRIILYNTTLSREKEIRDKLYEELGIIEILIQDIELNVVQNIDLITQNWI
jgi:hypothetical protein